jgi:myo-inositol-1(or 4)-monophosphatase
MKRSALAVDELAISIVRRVVSAGTALRRSRAEVGASLVPARTKSSFADLVTSMDTTTQERLIRTLTRLIPGSGVLAEEGELYEQLNEWTWIIDPIDGTTNFVHGFSYYSIAVALYQNEVPKIGVVHTPFDGKTVLAVANNGAIEFKGTHIEAGEPIRVSRVTGLEQTLGSFGLSYDRKYASQMFQVAECLFHNTQDVRRSGSAALDIVNVARGVFDLHIEGLLHPWDVAASSLILEEAGGQITDWNGHRVNWLEQRHGSSLLATNKSVHREALDLLNKNAPMPRPHQ